MQYRGADKHLHTHVLLYCILVYSCTCLKGLATVQKCDTSVYTNIYVFPCVLSFFFHPFLCKHVAFFLLVTNLLINCEDVSCPLTRAQITSWFFWFLLVFRSEIDLRIWSCKKRVFCFLHLIFYSRKWSILGWFSHHFLTPQCHKSKTALSL